MPGQGGEAHVPILGHVDEVTVRAPGQSAPMTYLVHVEGAFVGPAGPSSDGAPLARSGAYRLRALFPPAATTAATQLFLAEQAEAGLRPAGPISAEIADAPAEDQGASAV